MEFIFTNFSNDKHISYNLETEGQPFNETTTTLLFFQRVEGYSGLNLNIGGGSDPGTVLIGHWEDEIRQIVESGELAREWHEGSLPHTLNKILDNPVDMGV